MTPPLHVEVRVPQACYELLGTYPAIEGYLREIGVWPPQAQEVRWRLDVETPGYLITYTVPVHRPAAKDTP